MKAKTPEQLANKETIKRYKYTHYLTVKNMDQVKQIADKAGISASAIVDEAIASYLRSLKSK